MTDKNTPTGNASERPSPDTGTVGEEQTRQRQDAGRGDRQEGMSTGAKVGIACLALVLVGAFLATAVALGVTAGNLLNRQGSAPSEPPRKEEPAQSPPNGGGSDRPAPKEERPERRPSAAGFELATGNVGHYEGVLGPEFVGEVVNEGEAPAPGFAVYVELYGADGERVARDLAPSSSNVLDPGEKAVWRASLDKEAGEWQRYEVLVEQVENPTYYEKRDYRGVDVSRVGLSPPDPSQGNLTEPTAYPHVTGGARNTGDRAAHNAGVTFGLYDPDGDLVDVAFAPVPDGEGAGTLKKGASAGFTAPFQRPGLEVTDGYRVEAFPSAQNKR